MLLISDQIFLQNNPHKLFLYQIIGHAPSQGSRTRLLPCDCGYRVFWSTASHDINAVYSVLEYQSIHNHEPYRVIVCKNT